MINVPVLANALKTALWTFTSSRMERLWHPALMTASSAASAWNPAPTKPLSIVPAKSLDFNSTALQFSQVGLEMVGHHKLYIS